MGHEPFIAEVLEAVQPDIAILQEVYQNGTAERLAGKLSLQAAVVEGNSTRHMAILSRWPILEARSHHPYPPVHHVILEATLGHPTVGPLHVFGIHTIPLYSIGRELVAGLGGAHPAPPGAASRRPTLFGDGGFQRRGPARPRALRDALQSRCSALLAARQRQAAAGGTPDAIRRLRRLLSGATIPTTPATPCHRPIRASVWTTSSQTPPLIGHLQRCDVVTEPAAVHDASDHYPVLAEFDL